jgi:hypothetical protein
MPNYLHKAGGTLEGGFPWSIGMVSVSSATESAAQTNWDSGFNALWTSSAYNALLPTGTILTYTSTSTASGSFTQTTKTETTHNEAGTATAGLPFQVGTIVTWRTAQATKWGRGRIYLPTIGVGALASTGFVLSATALTDIQTALNAALAIWVGTLNFQILHRKATLTGPGALTLTPITGGDVSNKLVIQRRRGDKFTPTRAALTF